MGGQRLEAFAVPLPHYTNVARVPEWSWGSRRLKRQLPANLARGKWLTTPGFALQIHSNYCPRSKSRSARFQSSIESNT